MITAFARRLPAIALFAVVSLAGAPAVAGPFDTFVVFGDSLSDSGNNALVPGLYDPTQVVSGNSYVPSATYASGTYSNGPVWASTFASLIGLPLLPSLAGGNDFAFGGARTAAPGPGMDGFPYSLQRQAGFYLGANGNHASANGLYVIAGGGNDARAALDAIGGGANAAATIAAAAASFATDVGVIVDQLQAAGAQHILVWNTPDLGLAPAVVDSGFPGLGSFLAGQMNAALALRLAGEAGVSTFDIFGFGNLIAGNPGAYGFTNTGDACGAVLGANCDQYAYWDGIHPTAAAHRAIAEAVFAVAVPVPEPETWALFAFGLAVIGRVAKRRASGLTVAGPG